MIEQLRRLFSTATLREGVTYQTLEKMLSYIFNREAVFKGKVDFTGADVTGIGSSSWDGIKDKPASFPPSSHTHPEKQDTLVSGVNIKTVNTQSLLGSGDITISGGVTSVNTQTGVVVLDADDISDSATTNKFVTASDLTNLGNLSGVNTGDQDLSGYAEIVNLGGVAFSNDYDDLDNKPTLFTLPALTSGSVLFSNGTTISQDNSNLFWDDSKNYLGVGTATPDRILHAEVADSATNTVSYAQRLSHISSGTVTTSFGTGVEYELENASGTNRVAAAEEFAWSDAVNATEDTTYTLKLMRAGTLANAVSITSTPLVTIGTPGSNIGQVTTYQVNLSSNNSGGSISGGAGIVHSSNSVSGHTMQPVNTTVAVIGLNISNPPVSGMVRNTSGTSRALLNSATFGPTSGTGLMHYIEVGPTINQTGGANGITRGLYINPTLTSAAGWRSIEITNNTGYGIYQTGTATNYLAGVTLTKVLVEANTAGSGSPNIITATESRSVFTNEGATALNYHTLPTAAVGLVYTFYVQDTDGIRVVANTGDTIRIDTVVSAAAGYAESTTVGSSVTLTAINATEWVATSVIGTWTLT
jgi:hypothetical protein